MYLLINLRYNFIAVILSLKTPQKNTIFIIVSGYLLGQKSLRMVIFIGCYDKFFQHGMYVCVVCEEPLFKSDQKFDSGCGWPAFNDVLDKAKVKLRPDSSGGTFTFSLLLSLSTFMHA